MPGINDPVPLAGGNGAVSNRFEQALASRSAAQAQYLAQARRQRQLETISRVLRLVFDPVEELSRHRPEIADNTNRRLVFYVERPSPEVLALTRGKRFVPVPLKRVGVHQPRRCRQIAANAGFFSVLTESSRAELPSPASDVGKREASGNGEARHDC